MTKIKIEKVLTTAQYVPRCSCLQVVGRNTRVDLLGGCWMRVVVCCSTRGCRRLDVDGVRSTHGGLLVGVRGCCCRRNGAHDLMKCGLRAAADIQCLHQSA